VPKTPCRCRPDTCWQSSSRKERKSLKKIYRYELVKRSALFKIAAAWVITVPVSGLLAGIIYFTIRGMMLP
jgi:PiT family inorganic phosphate transporter